MPSRTKPIGPRPRILRGDGAEELSRLKSEPGKGILVHGGASLSQSLSRHGLIDEYHLVVHPVALGSGLPIFANRLDLQLVETRRFPASSVALTYRLG
jgi:dihydrofolate reductase